MNSQGQRGKNRDYLKGNRQESMTDNTSSTVEILGTGTPIQPESRAWDIRAEDRYGGR